jgi:hypothetical protein
VENRLLAVVVEERFDVIWFFNALLIGPSVINLIRQRSPDTRLAVFTPDNPFSAGASRHLWKNFRESIALADLHFSVRETDRRQYIDQGARTTHLLPQYFVPKTDFPNRDPGSAAQNLSSVVFVGHYEPDMRLDVLNQLSESGLDVRDLGTGWPDLDKLPPLTAGLKENWPIKPAYGDEYRNAITGSQIALSFFSKLNNDHYTRRTFQIPAMGVAMLSESSSALSKIFEPGVEVEMFQSSEQAVNLAQGLLSDPNRRQDMAQRALQRVHADGHDVVSRMRQFLKVVEEQS